MNIPQPFQSPGRQRARAVWSDLDTDLDKQGRVRTVMNEPEKLIPLHGGYRKLKSFQVAQQKK
jgi:hypothetical protein